jgi:hypothetical protein
VINEAPTVMKLSHGAITLAYYIVYNVFWQSGGINLDLVAAAAAAAAAAKRLQQPDETCILVAAAAAAAAAADAKKHM